MEEWDRRIERLRERHEALAESLELLSNDVHGMQALVKDIAEGTARLLHVAEIHERRLERREGAK
jgi:hypothetical protein